MHALHLNTSERLLPNDERLASVSLVLLSLMAFLCSALLVAVVLYK